MILAGDIGGTKTLLALYDDNGAEVIYQQRYASGSYPQFDQLLEQFLAAAGGESVGSISAAGFGIAGPITGEVGNQRVSTTNLPWQMESAQLSARLQGARVIFANDLVVSGIAAIASTPQQRIALNTPELSPPAGHIAVIAAGTGLGEALFYFDGQRHHPLSTEGGHSSFAPNTALEDQLLLFLRKRFSGHVSYERILSGSGFLQLYEFARAAGVSGENPGTAAQLAAAEDPSVVITELGCAGGDPLCVTACRLFARIYGAEAGNLALKSLPYGGVFVGGAIADHILPFMQSEFMAGFLDKGRFAALLRQIPVWIVGDPELALQGALLLARELRHP